MTLPEVIQQGCKRGVSVGGIHPADNTQSLNRELFRQASKLHSALRP